MTMPFGGGGANGFPPPGMGAPVSATSAAVPAATAATAKVAAIPAVVGVGGSRLYGADGTLLVSLDSGATVLVTGRSADNTWLSVIGSDGTAGSDGWIEAAQLIVYGLHRLAVTDVPAAVQAAAGVQTAATSTADAAGTPDGGLVAATLAVTVTPVLSTGDALTVPAVAPVTNTVATAAATAAATATATVKTDQGRLNIRSGPGTGYLVVAKANDGETYPVLGRSEAADWLELQLDGGETGWASAAYLEVDGDVSALPVPSVPALCRPGRRRAKCRGRLYRQLDRELNCVLACGL